MPGHTCVHMHMYVCMHVCVCVCVVCMFVWCGACVRACVCVSLSRAAGSGTASTYVRPWPYQFFSKKSLEKITLTTQKHHHYNFIVPYDITITMFPHNRLARICSDIAAMSVLVVGVCVYNNCFLEGC